MEPSNFPVTLNMLAHSIGGEPPPSDRERFLYLFITVSPNGHFATHHYTNDAGDKVHYNGHLTELLRAGYEPDPTSSTPSFQPNIQYKRYRLPNHLAGTDTVTSLPLRIHGYVDLAEQPLPAGKRKGRT